MAHYTSRAMGGYAVYGPESLEAGRADSRELAQAWSDLLDDREDEIAAALDREDYPAAERIWDEVEAEARATTVTVEGR